MNLKTIIVGDKDLTEKQEKIRKIFMYLVSGGITTVVNWVLYIVIDKLIQIDMTVDIIDPGLQDLAPLKRLTP